MNTLRRVFVAASTVGLTSLALLTAGCPSVPGECRTDGDCAADEVCREFACVDRTGSTVDAGPDPVVDAGEPPADVPVIEDDAGADEEDAGADEIDSGPSVADAGDDDDAGTSDDDAGASDDAGGSDGG